jgi:uncharacterized protein (DUF697 family)
MSERQFKAMQIVQRNAMWSAGAGLIPVPVFDLAAVGVVQVKMLKELAAHYGLPLKEDWGKATVATLIGAVAPTSLAYGVGGGVLRSVPIVGPALGAVAVPAFSLAVTYAIGKVFIQHFESGGTFLDFNPEAVREHFKREFEAARA